MRRAVSYNTKGDRDRAIADLTQCLGINPKSVMALTLRGEIYAAKGQHKLAVEDFEAALLVDKDSARAKSGLEAARTAVARFAGVPAAPPAVPPATKPASLPPPTTPEAPTPPAPPPVPEIATPTTPAPPAPPAAPTPPSTATPAPAEGSVPAPGGPPAPPATVTP